MESDHTFVQDAAAAAGAAGGESSGECVVDATTTTTKNDESTTPSSILKAKPILLVDIIGEKLKCTAEERRSIYANICGRPPPEIAIWEERLNALEHEIWQLPDAEKATFVRLIRENPFLFTILSQQGRIFLGESGSFDAKQAAKRIVNYWEKREKLFGKKELPSLSMEHCMKDFMSYTRSEQVLENPNADHISKELSRMYIEYVDHCKNVALDAALNHLLKKEEHVLEWMRECELVEEEDGIITFIGMEDDEKMLFIRSESFNEQLAAKRIINYWEMKYNIFGPAMASEKEITLNDLAETCWEEFLLGFIRIMPGTDARGRTVILFDLETINDIDTSQEDNILKCVWYVFLSALEEQSCQRNGIVVLAKHRGSNRASYAEVVSNGFRSQIKFIFTDCAPVQCKAVHLFFPPTPSWWRSWFRCSSQTQSTEPLHKLLVIHDGVASQEQELLDLAECGIYPSQIPTDLGGDVPFESYIEWLEDRKLNGL